jgi:hypothetical protein
MHTNEQTNDDFAYIHIREGIDGKNHPIGTVAVSLVPNGIEYRVGYAIQNSREDRWDSALGRSIAAGRAARSKNDRLSFRVLDDGSRFVSRQTLLKMAIAAVQDALADSRSSSRRFNRALRDTLRRIGG